MERAELTSGSTFHSAGLVGQLRSDPALTRMNVHSVALYRELAAGEHDPGWMESGSLRLASSPERMVEIRRQHGWAQRAGLPLELISAEEARELFPLMATDGVLGRRTRRPTARSTPPGCARRWRPVRGPPGCGSRSTPGCWGSPPSGPQGRRVVGVRTDRGESSARPSSSAAGCTPREIAALVDVRIPVVPMSHQYLVTAPLPAGTLPRAAAAVAARSRPARLLPAGDRRPRDGRVRARVAARLAGHVPPADFNGKLLRARLGPLRRDPRERRRCGCRCWPTSASRR